ncbi:MAG: hypothetical protein SGJ04_05190 [Bacteroidota bacterium]|nr:hypothetical protein [Bacteroidota bacterium]
MVLLSKRIIKSCLGLLLITLVIGACKKEGNLGWDINALVPLASLELSISNLLPDSIISIDNNKITIVNRRNVKTIFAKDILTVNDTEFVRSVKLSALDLGKRVITRSISLGFISKQPNVGQLVFLPSFNGSTIAIPAINNISTGTTDVDANSLFSEATFESGFLVLKIENDFPIDINNMIFTLKNKGNGVVVATDNIPLITAKTSVTKKYDLSNKTVEGNLVLDITSINSPGSKGVPILIDTSDAIKLIINGEDFNIRSAKAIFPSQNLVEEQSDVRYNLGGAEIINMKLRQGNIKITAFNNFKDSLKLTYNVYNAFKNGQGISIYRIVPPPVGGVQGNISETVDIAGYTVSLTGIKGNSFNTFSSYIKARIDSSGNEITLNVSDSIRIKYGLFNVVPEYAQGYLGNTIYKVGPEKVKFNVFGGISAGQIKIQDLQAHLEIINSIGATGQVKIRRLTALNSKTGAKLDLSSAQYINTLIPIKSATDNPLRASYTKLDLNNANSNIGQLLELLPDELEYDLEVVINPEGNTNNYRDFIYYDSKVEANLNISFPLNFSAAGLTLTDTISLNIGNIKAIDQIEEATLNLLVKNGFPLNADMQLYTLKQVNNQWVKKDSLLPNGATIVAGAINPDGLVTQASDSRIIAKPISGSDLNGLIAGDRILVKVKLNTIPTNKFLQLYSDYLFKVQLNGKFKYNANF